MTDFSKAVIYSIYSKDKTVLEFYIGSAHDYRIYKVIKQDIVAVKDTRNFMKKNNSGCKL